MRFFRRAAKDDKASGEEFFGKGQWAQALEAYQRVIARDPGNVKIWRRIADLRARLGKRSEALDAYRKVADLYAGSGFLVQAIAIHKIILRLDPSAEGIGNRLAELYSARGITSQASGEERRELPRIPLFSDLDAESFRVVLDRLVPRSLSMGEVVFQQGDPGDSIFIVASGAVRVSRGDLLLAELSDGEFFGEAAFFSREPRNANVTAVAPTELLEIRRQDLEALMARHPGVTNALGAFYRRRILDGMLAASPLFRSLPEADRKKVADLFRIEGVRAGQAVVQEGETDRALYLIKSGRFEVSTVAPLGGRSIRLAELGPGDFFGEVALVSRGPRTATVKGLEEGEVLRIEGDALDPFLAGHPGLRQALEKAREVRAQDTVAKVLGKGG